jgi:RHS repeat-associated protein
MKEGSQYYFYHNDHLGTPQKMTSVSGAVVWSAKYESFGKAIVDPNSTITTNLRFPGQYFDDDTGVHYNYHRYYDPSTGRYFIPDPIGLNGGLNLFPYIDSNPVNDIDPTGEFAIAIPPLVVIVLPAAIIAAAWYASHETQKAITRKGKKEKDPPWVRYPDLVKPPPDRSKWKEGTTQPEDPRKYECSPPPEDPCIYICARATQGKWYEKTWAWPICILCL